MAQFKAAQHNAAEQQEPDIWTWKAGVDMQVRTLHWQLTCWPLEASILALCGANSNFGGKVNQAGNTPV